MQTTTTTRRKKRLIVELDPADFALLKGKADAANISVANYVRREFGFVEERQGVKRPDSPSKSRRVLKSKGTPC